MGLWSRMMAFLGIMNGSVIKDGGIPEYHARVCDQGWWRS